MALANGRQGDGPTKLSKEDQDDLDAINSAIDRMRAFTPSDPYVLTIPQDVEPRYHHQYAIQARQWLEHTPFEYREHESTQYQTFIYHEPSKEMYMLHNSRPTDISSSQSTNGDDTKKPGTGANTPNAAPKKKISLDTYKKKLTGQTPEVTPGKELGQPTKKPAAKAPVKGPVERLKEDEDVLAAVEEDASLQPKKDEVNTEKAKDLKRKREEPSQETNAPEKKQVPPDTPQESSEPAAKKVKTAQPQELPSKTQAPTKPELKAEPVKSPQKPVPPAQEEAKDTVLPPKLSPPPEETKEDALPPKLSPISSPQMPTRLSPTIPANIEATLKAQEEFRSSQASDVSLSKDNTGRTLTPPPANSAKKKSPVPRNGFRANSSSPAVRSDAEERGRPLTSIAKKSRPSEMESAEDSEEIAVARKTGAAKSSTQPKEPRRKLVGLRFRKKQSIKDLQAYLKMKPTPGRWASLMDSESEGSKAGKSTMDRYRETRTSGANMKGVAQKVGPSKKAKGVSSKNDSDQSTDRKRSREDDSDDLSDAPQTKRKKDTKDSAEPKKKAPTTPKPSSVLSPPSTQRSSSNLSPDLRKDILSTSMKRDLSNDSNTLTPNPASQQSSPPNGRDGLHTNGVPKPPSSQPSTKTPKQQAWEVEQKRLEKLGRQLKHAASSHIQSSPDKKADSAPSEAQKLAAVTSLESLMAFMLAFTCADEAALAADPKLQPATKVWRSMQPYFHFVKKNCEPFAPLYGLACSLGMVFNQHILNLTAQRPSESSSVNLLETQTTMRRAADEVEIKLDVDTLQDTFPRTWARRERGTLSPPNLEPRAGLMVPYKLPIGIQTSPLRAVRAVYSMLEEWLEKQEGLEYGLKLKLSS